MYPFYNNYHRGPSMLEYMAFFKNNRCCNGPYYGGHGYPGYGYGYPGYGYGYGFPYVY